MNHCRRREVGKSDENSHPFRRCCLKPISNDLAFDGSGESLRGVFGKSGQDSSAVKLRCGRGQAVKTCIGKKPQIPSSAGRVSCASE